MSFVTESLVEDAALAWLGSLGYAVKRGLEAWNPALHRLLVDGVTVEYRTLASIRDMLLPKLLSGEIPGKDTEKFVEAET